MRTIALALVLLAALAARAGADEPVPADPAPAVPVATAPPPPADPTPSPEMRDDRPWSLYHDAFRALLEGGNTRARRKARLLLHDYPGHPASALVQRSELLGGPGAAIDAPRRRDVEAPSRAARAELALFQTLHGMYVGVEVCFLLDCEEGVAVFGLALAGAGAGAAISLNAFDNLTSGQRALLNSGTAWGAANGILLTIAIDSDDQQTVVGTLLAGQTAGLLLGGSLFGTKATAGQVGLANSFGQWAAVISGLSLTTLSSDYSGKDLATTILVALDVGLVAGAYVASRQTDVTRAQTLVVDAGGIVGTIAGGSLGVVVSGAFDSTTTRGFAAAGAVVGLGAAYYLTRNWNKEPKDAGDTAIAAFIAPPERGQGALAGVGFAW
jgi:hypothetical protein